MGAAMLCAALYSIGMMGHLPTWRPLPPLASGAAAALQQRVRGEATRARQLSDSGAVSTAAAEEDKAAAGSSYSSGTDTGADTRAAAFGAAGAAAAVPVGAWVHGFVDKSGPLDIRSWHSSHRQWRERRVQAWWAKRQRLLADGAPLRLALQLPM